MPWRGALLGALAATSLVRELWEQGLRVSPGGALPLVTDTAMHAIQTWGERAARLSPAATTARPRRPALVPATHSASILQLHELPCIELSFPHTSLSKRSFVPTPQALASGPAAAGEVVPTVQGSIVKQQQAELQRLLEERGAKLPELTASPSVRSMWCSTAQRSVAQWLLPQHLLHAPCAGLHGQLWIVGRCAAPR